MNDFWQANPAAFMDYWHRCEQVAVHFNDLNARFRLQALAGLALAGTILGGFKAPLQVGHHAVAGVLFSLFLVWFAVAWIDFWYYGRLLRGAVQEIIRIEKASGGVVGMSTAIEAACTVSTRRWRTSRIGRLGFYILPALPFLFGAWHFWTAAEAGAITRSSG